MKTLLLIPIAFTLASCGATIAIPGDETRPDIIIVLPEK
jgi:hypothetical protein